jgi:predicted nucleic acid-binding protein
LNYFDTSFLVPLFIVQAASAAVQRQFAAIPIEHLMVSHWTILEFSSALAKEVRLGNLPAPRAADAKTEFDVALKDFTIMLPGLADHDLAHQYVTNQQTSLRGGDALHLAIAANHNATAIYSLDKTFLKAGAILGLPVQTA